MANRSGSPIPGEVYVQFVRSLYESRGTLLVGGISHMLIALMVYIETEHALFAVLAILFILIAGLRYVGLGRNVDDLQDPKVANDLELEYVFNAGLQGVLLGCFAFFCSYVYPNEFGELGSLAIILASLTTVVGRNYGSKRAVATFTITMLVPTALAYIMRMQLSYFVLALLMYPFGMIVVKSSEGIRRILVQAVMEGKKADQLAQRFDHALNTMSHALLMFDRSGAVVVGNERAARFLGFSDPKHLIGRRFEALLMRGVAGQVLSRASFLAVRASLSLALNTGKSEKVVLSLLDGRHIEFTASEGDDDLAVLIFEDVTLRIDAEAKIRHMACYDSLTDLPNRAYFQDLVRGCLEVGPIGRMCALAIIDLDDFKAINDSFGHPTGDQLIKALANKLRSYETEAIMVGRFGGDEFMVYFDKIESHEDFSAQFTQLFESLLGKVEMAGVALNIQASAGVTVVPVSPESDLDSITVMADLALYNAKEKGKMRWLVYENEMDTAFRMRQRLKSELRQAIQDKQLHVVYQPIIDSMTLHIVGCETLCRWNHPELGEVSPAIFIPLAEEMGLISEISSQVLAAACRDCATWPEHYGVSVNLSAKDFANLDVVGKVFESLESVGLAPHRLEVEVTETALLLDRENIQVGIEKLHAGGVTVALDDFGTGYSSLSYLHTLPLDRVKIDGSFLHDVSSNNRSQKLLKSVVSLARNIGLAVTIEGVETEEQLLLLRTLIKPDRVQGFLFGAGTSSENIQKFFGRTWSFKQVAEMRADEERFRSLRRKSVAKDAV